MKDRFRNMIGLALTPLLSLAITQVMAQPANNNLSGPTPRFDDGRVNFGPPPGETGTWSRRTKYLAVNPDSYQASQTLEAPIHIDDVPLKPWARGLTHYRQTLALASEPYSRCKVTSGPRQVMSPYGLEIVDIPELNRAYILNISNSQSYRVIYMDGRDHPKDVRPTYMGHSIGHWEGDSLVVDTVGLNERSWMNRDGFPSTEQTHLIERFSRVNYDTLVYEVTIDDPAVFNAPWTSELILGWSEGNEMFEYICQENNRSPEAMLEGEERRGLKITP